MSIKSSITHIHRGRFDSNFSHIFKSNTWFWKKLQNQIQLGLGNDKSWFMFWMLDLKINSSLISIVYCRLRSCIFKVMFVWEKHKCLSNDETVYVWDNDTRLTYLVKRGGGWIQVTMTRQFTDLIMVWTSSIYNRVWTIFTRYINIEKKNLLGVLQS